MKATSITEYRVLDIDDLELADDIVKCIVPEAMYMKKYDYGTKLFYPLEKQVENMSFVYDIGGKLFNTIWTNQYDELVNIYEDIKKPPKTSMEIVVSKDYKQITIFDY